MVVSFNKLKRNLKSDFDTLPKIKVAILGDTPTQLFHQALKGYGFEVGRNFEIHEADYDQVDRQILDPSSDLYKSNLDYIVIFLSSEKLLSKFSKLGNSEKKQFANEQIQHIRLLCETINKLQKCKIILFNFPELSENVFGNFSNKTDLSFTYQIRKINYELMNLSHQIKNIFINDVVSLQSKVGRTNLFSPSIYTNSGIIYNLDFLPLVAKNVTDIILAAQGIFKKCLILDLDNTLWGGIIGDDGIGNIQIGDLGIGKAYTELQCWIKQLKERGIILCVCSKNNEEIAKEPFTDHSDMVLRLEDIAVFVANWETKAENIRYIQSVLNIGFDSMVFLDDNPFERNFVRTEIPDICVPELPEDPAEYLSFIQHLNLFETASLSEEDENRTQQYQEESKRVQLQKSFINEDDFLSSLEMISEVAPFNKFNTSRVAQLTQRSNQFNLRTIRYTEQDIENIINDNNYLTLSFSLADKYGDYGLISLIILKKDNDALFIDTWIMSCRVLKRGMEKFVLNTIVELAGKNNFKNLIGEYIPTSKNGMTKDHYHQLGFKSHGNVWMLNVNDYKKFNIFIKNK